MASYQLVPLPAYPFNRTKRLIKTPKAYWSDPGLALRLAGHATGGVLRASAERGPRSGELAGLMWYARPAHGVEAFAGEGWPGTMAEQALDARTVVTLDADAGIDAEAAAALPGAHALGIGRIEQAVRAEVAEDAAPGRGDP